MDSIKRGAQVRYYTEVSDMGLLGPGYICAVVDQSPWLDGQGRLVVSLQTRTRDFDEVLANRLAPLKEGDSVSWFYIRSAPARAGKGEG